MLSKSKIIDLSRFHVKYFQLFLETLKENTAGRILQVLKEKKQKPTPWEEANDISRGYLQRAAERGINIGVDVVEKILLQYPDIDPYWLITGSRLTGNKGEKHTTAINTDEAAIRQEIEKYRRAAASLARVNLINDCFRRTSRI